jgi:hypothetical protein
MKNTILYASLVITIAVGALSCANNPKDVNTTSNADTAVLVNDTANNLNANPVNDTMVNDTVHNQ